MVIKKRRFPKHLGATADEWRQKKRQEWKRLMHALDEYQHGAAYTPNGDDLHALQRCARRIEEDLEGDWIAW